MARFSSWRRPRLVHQSTEQDGRLGRTLQVTLTDSAVPAQPAGADIAFGFRNASDVARLTERAIRHRAPAPGVRDEETTKCTYVDFHAPDLPWRYTPRRAEGDTLRPWLALVVGTPDEVRISGTTVTLSSSVLADYDLTTSWRWAHVQSPDSETNDDLGTPAPDRFSRLLSLRRLLPLTTYIAVLVPTFTPRGTPLWAGGVVDNGGRPLPALSWWTFATGEGGDFETLAAQLRIPPAADLGKASLTYRAADIPIGPLEVRGALQSLQAVQPAVDGEADLARDVANAVLASAGAPDLLGPPAYGRPWVPSPTTAAGWVEQLRADARVRIHAGTGQWTGVEAQDELMQAAVAQSGSLADAAGLIARTASGLATSGSLWARSLPSDPVARLQILAPMTTRLPTDTGVQTVADAVSTPERTLDRALLTGAGQRLLTRTSRLDKTPVASATDLLQAAASGPDSGPDPSAARLWEALVPDGERLYVELWTALAKLRRAALAGRSRYLHRIGAFIGLEDPRRIDEWQREFIQDELPRLQDRAAAGLGELTGECGERVWLWAAEFAGTGTWDDLLARTLTTPHATDLIYGQVQTAVLCCLLPTCAGEPQVHPESECSRLVALLRIPAPHDRVPVPLPGLGNAVSRAVDPRSDDPPARRSLDAQLPDSLRGRLAPPRYPLGLDFPTWTLLRRYEPDWLLPGAASVPRHTIIALRTNPVFIDAFLVGLNSQFLSEVRWRGLQVDRWGTPLRMFFAPTDERTGVRIPDVAPIEDWPDGSALGTHRTPTGATPGPPERLVLLFTTPLFRRYPRTLVYLQNRLGDDELNDLVLMEPPQLVQPPGTTFEQWTATRAHIPPVFSGTIGPDQVFFLFDIPPEDLDGYFLVLDEPPSEQRFRNDLSHAQASAAQVAEALLDPHTRVALDGQALEAMGLDPQ